MDERFRRLKRSQDPASRRRLGRELMRSGAVDQHIEDFCLLGEYLGSLENSLNTEDQDHAASEKHRILTGFVRCLGPLTVFALVRLDDELDANIEGVFPSREAAQIDLCDRFRRSAMQGFEDAEYAMQEIIQDFLQSYQQRDYEEAIRLINHTLYGHYWIEETTLRS